MKNCLLLLNPQNDFLSPSGLCRKMSGNDIIDFKNVFKDNLNKIDGLVLMMDSHYPMDISHSSYWIDFNGNHPEVGTKISKKEVKGRKYSAFTPNVPKEISDEKQKMVLEYMENLEKIGVIHKILTNHCIIGTDGHNVLPLIMDLVIDWTNTKGRNYLMSFVGMYQHAEHIGVFEAVVQNPHVPETMLNQGTLEYLDSFENVYVWGPDETVLASMKQLERFARNDDNPNAFEHQDIIERYVVISNNQEIVDYCNNIGFRVKKLEDVKL